MVKEEDSDLLRDGVVEPHHIAGGDVGWGDGGEFVYCSQPIVDTRAEGSGRDLCLGQGDCHQHVVVSASGIRERVEETEIKDIVFVEGYREEIFYKYNKKGTPSTKLVVFFLGKTEAKKCTMSHEHLDYCWLPYDAAYNKATFDNAKNLLKEAEKLLG